MNTTLRLVLFFSLLNLGSAVSLNAEPGEPSAQTPFDEEQTAAPAEEAKEPPRLKPRRRPFPKKPSRKPSSVESESGDIEGSVSTGSSEIQIAVALAAGLTSLSTGDATKSSSRDAQGLTQNLCLAVQAELEAARYFNVDLDFSYGVAPSQDTQVQSGTQMTTWTKSLQANALMAHAKGQYPFHVGKVRVIPHLGLGYGYYAMSEDYDLGTGASGLGTNSLSVSGLTFVAGFRMDPAEGFTFGVDFAPSLTASANYSGATNSSSVGGSLSRLRVGGWVEVARGLAVGAQYIRRGLSTDTPPATGTSDSVAPGPDEVQNQFQGLARYTF